MLRKWTILKEWMSGIPCSIKESTLEGIVLKLFRKVNVPIGSSNVGDFYCLKSNNKTLQKLTIKLSKGKVVYRVLEAKSSFKIADFTENGIPRHTATFLIQSLCSYYKFLWSKSKKLWLKEVTEIFWASKESCWIRLIDNSVKIITNIAELTRLFLGHVI